MKRISILAVLVALALPATAGAHLYFVSPSGNDANSGEETPFFSGQTHPWQHLTHAAEVVKGEDAVLIEPGSYAERLVIDHGGAWYGSPSGPVKIAEVYAEWGTLVNEAGRATVVQRVDSCFLVNQYTPRTGGKALGNQLWVRFIEDRMSECEYTDIPSQFVPATPAISTPLLQLMVTP